MVGKEQALITFAAHALQGMLANPTWNNSSLPPHATSECAWDYAVAMVETMPALGDVHEGAVVLDKETVDKAESLINKIKVGVFSLTGSGVTDAAALCDAVRDMLTKCRK